MADNASSPSPATPGSSVPVKRRRWLRALGWMLIVTLLTLTLSAGALWWWIGRDDSLNQTLQRIAGWMPANQTLVAREVTGSVKNGGHIGWLQWQSPTMKVEVKNARIGWQLRPLIFSRTLKLGEVHMAEVRIASTPDSEDKPSDPLTSLALPLKIELPFKVDQILWQGPPTAVVQDLSGHYAYTGSHHELQVRSLHVADGNYQMLARLEGAAPMQLKVDVQGKLQAPNPLHASDAAAPSLIHVEANAQIQGTLATEAAKLLIKAHAQAQAESQNQEQPAQSDKASEIKNPEKNNSDKRKQLSKKEQTQRAAQPMQAEVEASIAPWQAQPVLAAQAALQNLDLGAFWPQGPRTALTGEFKAGHLPSPNASPASQDSSAPESAPSSPATRWALSVNIDNALPGPWDLQRLPLAHLHTHAVFDGQQWQVDEGTLDIGKGQIQLTGHYVPAQQVFGGQLQILQLNPADILSTLDAAPLQGQIEARTVPAPTPASTGAADEAAPLPAVAFSVDLKAAGASTGRALRIQTLATQGQWHAPALTLEDLRIEALQARVEARRIIFDTASQQVQAQLQASVPGSDLRVEADMHPERGQAQAQLQLSSLEQFMRWLRHLPGLKDTLSGAQLEGSAHLNLGIQGGWGKLLERINAPHGATIPASGLKLQVQLNGEKIRYQPAAESAAQALSLPSAQLSLSGSPENLQITLNAQAQQASARLQVDTALHAGLTGGKGFAPLDWQARVEKLLLHFTPGGEGSGAWIAQLKSAAPVQIRQQTSGKTVLSTTYPFSAGQLQVTPPPATASSGERPSLAPVLLNWEEGSITHTASGQWGVRSKGQAHAIPLAWVDALSLDDDESLLERAGLSGDLSLNAHWNLDTLGKALKADLGIERASGDIRLAVDDGASTTVIQTTGPRAGHAGQKRTRQISGTGMRAHIKDLKLTVQAQGSQVNAKLTWDSERAGTLKADLHTQLSYQQESWTLPSTAPLSGQLHASMPDIGLWALFAPPGWRVKGTLAADASLNGTLAAPKWQGNIKADDMSIVSLLDGVDLRDGILRARLQDTRLELTDIRFKGGKGSKARILGYSGNLTSAPEDGGELHGSGYAQFTPQNGSSPASLSMNLQAKASKLQVLVRADRQVSISGDLQTKLEQGLFSLLGNLTVDRASIILPEESAPSLDKDVVVHSAASRKAEEEERRRAKRDAQKEQAKATPSKLPHILVKLNLGQDFALQGFGITTRLTGQLEIQGPSYLGGPPRVTGEIRTVQGRYRAWGQSLNVENGLISFNGPYNNPSLDILALRPNIAVTAGVQVLGTAQAPRVLLYSDPDLPDAEKLSWAILGRDPAAGGASSAVLQQAALALLAGNKSSSGIASSLGLDELGFKGGGDGTDASEAALTLGKRLSDKLYLTYEQSLSGAMGLIYIFYDLSRNVTLRAQTGTTSALDIVYTMRKD